MSEGPEGFLQGISYAHGLAYIPNSDPLPLP